MTSIHTKSQNYFEILGISEDASQQDINNAYLKLIKQSKTNNSINPYLINEAYNILKNPLERYHYTRSLHMNVQEENVIDKLYNEKQYDKLILENADNCIDTESMKIKPIECNESSIDFENSLEKLKSERDKQMNDINKDIEHQFGGKPSEEQVFNNLQNQSSINNFLLNNDDNESLKSAFNEDDANYTLLKDIEQVNNANKMFDNNRSKMEEAIKSGNIDEFMRLRAEEKKIITKY